MPRALMLCLLACFVFAAPARAASFSKADYTAASAALDDIETLINTSITKLHNGMTPADARAALPHLQERLQWMRDTKVTAARIDTSHTLRTASPDSQRAQCIIMRAGLMDEVFQDVMVNVSMKARGVGDDALLPLDQVAFDAATGQSTCRR